jgi:hypothetical protein
MSDELNWHKSPLCDDENCVEIAFGADSVLVRDSKDPSGPTLMFTESEWHAFVNGVRSGVFGDKD